MNSILITNQPIAVPARTYALSYPDANNMLPILRAAHFNTITLHQPTSIPLPQLRFALQFTRILSPEGKVKVQGQTSAAIGALLKQLGLFPDHQNTSFFKTQPLRVDAEPVKLAIGFHTLETDEIDEDELLEGENLNIDKKNIDSCATKSRACANCSCGRKEQEKASLSKEELVEAVNEGKPVSGCGKCFMGDSFRCATCPYNGMPAFKPGDRLKLEEGGAVVVQQANTFVSTGGKVRLQL